MEYSQREMNDMIFDLLEINTLDSISLNNCIDDNYNLKNPVENILLQIRKKNIFNNLKTFKFFEDRVNRINKANIGLADNFQNLEEEFKYSITMKQFIKETMKEHQIRKMRNIKGDGNCFFRTIIFGYLEKIVSMNLIPSFCSFLFALIDKNVFTIYSLAQNKIGSRIVNKIIDTLQTIEKIGKNEIQKRMNALYLFFVFDHEFDLSSVRLLRIFNYLILQKNLDLMADQLPVFLLDTTIDREKPGELAKKILTDGLEGGILNQFLCSLFLEIKIKTALLDSNSTNTKPYFQEISSNSNQFTFPLKNQELRKISNDHIFALLKPGHYDLIYQELYSTIKLTKILETQSTQFLFLEKIFYANLCNKNSNYIDKTFSKGVEESKFPNKADNFHTPDFVTPGNPEDFKNNNIGEENTPYGPGSKDQGGDSILYQCLHNPIPRNQFKDFLIDINDISDSLNDHYLLYRSKLMCPGCYTEHNYEFWIKILGENDYKEIINKMLERNNKKKKNSNSPLKTQTDILKPLNLKVKKDHGCSIEVIEKGEFLIKCLEVSKILLSKQKYKIESPNFSSFQCPLCKKDLKANNLKQLIGEEEFQRLCSSIQIYFDQIIVKIHDHSFILKEEMKKELIIRNSQEPFIYDLYFGSQFKCYYLKCNKKISKAELRKSFKEEELEQMIDNLKNSLKTKRKSENLKFHCGLIDYEESLKYVSKELIEHNKITPNSKYIKCFRCNQNMNIEQIKNLKILEAEMKELCNIVGIEFKMFKPFQLRCKNLALTESEYIDQMINYNLKRFYSLEEIKYSNKLYCGFCYSSHHPIVSLKESYGEETIKKIIDGIKNKLGEKIEVGINKNINGFPKGNKTLSYFHNHSFEYSENNLKEIVTKDLMTNAKVDNDNIIYHCIKCNDTVDKIILANFLGTQPYLRIEKAIKTNWSKQKISYFHKHSFEFSENDLKEYIKKDFITKAIVDNYNIIYKCPKCQKSIDKSVFYDLFSVQSYSQIEKEIKEKWNKPKNPEKEIEKSKRPLYGNTYLYRKY